jgi:tetratricopeptide (TPR) repeat protein
MRTAVTILTGIGMASLAACAGGQAKVEPAPVAPQVITIKPREIVADANQKIEAGEYQAAVDALDGLLVKQPDNEVARYNRGLAHQMLGNWREAEDDYRQVLAAKSDDIQTSVNLSAVLREQGKLAEAAKVIDAQLKADPFNPDLLNNLSVIYREEKQYDDAIGAVRKLLMRDKNNVDAYKNLALVYFDQGKLRLSETILQNAQRMSEEQERTDPDIYVNLGMIYLGREENGRAMAAFKKALELDPDHLEANYNIGALALAHRDYDLAAASYEKVATRQPTSADVAASLGFAYQGQRKLPEAVSQFKTARTLYGKAGQSENEQVLYQLIIVSQEANNLQEAKQYALEYMKQKGITCSPDDYEGFCARYNGIEILLQMAADAELQRAEEERQRKEAEAKAEAAKRAAEGGGESIFTEEDTAPDEGSPEGGAAEGEDAGEAPADGAETVDEGAAAPPAEPEA